MRWLDLARLAALLPVATLVACDQPVTGPELPAVPPLAASIEDPVGWFPGWSSPRAGDLVALLDSEEARIAFEREQSEVVYDSLEAVWDAYLRGDPQGDESPFLMCDPLPYAAETQVIGRDGGDVRIGPHKLSIPRGALSQYTVITVEQVVSTHVEIRLSPHGLKFLKQPTLTLSYKHCLVPRDHKRGVAYVGEDGQILEWPSSYDQERAKGLLGLIWHFSTYEAALRGYVVAGG